MIAIVEIVGQQYQVKSKDLLTVSLIQDASPGDELTFSNILAVHGDAGVQIGLPYLKGTVKATVVGHGKGDKVIVFKKKRRKGYRKRNGHRQRYTQIRISDIVVA